MDEEIHMKHHSSLRDHQLVVAWGGRVTFISGVDTDMLAHVPVNEPPPIHIYATKVKQTTINDMKVEGVIPGEGFFRVYQARERSEIKVM